MCGGGGMDMHDQTYICLWVFQEDEGGGADGGTHKFGPNYKVGSRQIFNFRCINTRPHYYFQ